MPETYQYENETEQRMFEFLDRLRESSVTNMFGAGPYLQEQFDIESKNEANEIVLKWMKTFEQRHPQ